MNRSKILAYLLYAIFSLITIYIFGHVNQEVPETYMDEFFHYHQARNYCLGNYGHWDPSITTPPGLYLFTNCLEIIVQNIQVFRNFIVPCSLGLARLTNVIFILATPWIFIEYFQSIKSASYWTSMLSAISICTHPLIYFFVFLYYTDVGSLLFAILSLTFHVHQHRFLAATVCFVAVTFRQTNIIIAAYEIGWTLIDDLRRSKDSEIVKIFVMRPMNDVFFTEYFTVIYRHGRKELLSLMKILYCVIRKCQYQFLLIVLFIIFFVKNNYSITLGHQEHHQMVFHAVQLLYFFIYSGFFLMSHLFQAANRHQLIKMVYSHPILTLMGLVLIIISVKYYTYEHLFLISDNRHYTFYIWSRLFKRYEMFRYLMSPGYLLSMLLIFDQLEDRSFLNVLLLFGSVFILTVFQKLLEFRYFILPYVLLRLSIRVRGNSNLFLELAQAALINAITIYVFCHRTFIWSSEPNIKQRFMY